MRVAVPILVFILIGQTTDAQSFNTLRSDREPLNLQQVGSFYVGGEKQNQNATELGFFSSDGAITINQMYVNFMVPQQPDSISFVLIHGMNLSGKTWETTPDGRMGWYEYLVRKGFPVYVVDQVGAGRSGFNQKNYNLVREGIMASKSQETFQRISDDNTWINFRFGLKGGEPVKDVKFPINSRDEFSKQSIPFSLFGLPSPNPNFVNLSALATALKETVLISHSQSGGFPIETALMDPTGIDAIVMLEPGGTGAQYSEEQIRFLTSIPIVIVYGDNIDNETGIPGHSWKSYFDGWGGFVKQVNNAGGKARLIYLPEMDISGNSHMLMQDINNQEVADIILQWLDENL